MAGRAEEKRGPGKEEEEGSMNEVSDAAATVLGSLMHRALGLPPGSMVLLALFWCSLTSYANWTIVRRAGYPGCWSFMFYVPCMNVLFLLAFAFGRWPVESPKSAR